MPYAKCWKCGYAGKRRPDGRCNGLMCDAYAERVYDYIAWKVGSDGLVNTPVGRVSEACARSMGYRPRTVVACVSE
jgi:hypothetical protein